MVALACGGTWSTEEYTRIMRLGVIVCAMIGHRWQPDAASTDSGAVLRCERCGRHQLAPDGTAFGRRVGAETGRDRAVGPF